MIHSVLPLFLVMGLGASGSFVGLVDGLGECIASCLKLFSGILSDIGRRKPLIVLGYGLSTAIKPMFALAGSPMVILMARCLDRVGKGIRGAPRDALIVDVTEPEVRGAAFGLRQSLDSVGAFLGPALAFALLSVVKDGYRQVFWVAVIPAVFAVLLLTFGIREPKEHRALDKPKTVIDKKTLKLLGHNFWYIVAVVLVFTMGNSSDSFILLKAAKVGIKPQFIPLVFVVMNIVYSISAYPAGKLADKIGHKQTVLISFLLYAAVYTGIAFAQTAWHFWVLLALYGAYLGLSQGNLLAWTADRTPSHLRGTAFGFLNLAMGLSVLPASLLGGWLWDNVSTSATFLVGAGFATAAALLLMFEPKFNDSLMTNSEANTTSGNNDEK